MTKEFLYPSVIDSTHTASYGAGPVFTNTAERPAPSIRLSLGAKKSR